MGFFSRLFGSADPTSSASGQAVRRTTATRPFRIEAPVIGFLNLRGVAGETAMSADRRILAPLFWDVRESCDAIPRCAVLFVYCDLDPSGKIVNRSERLREIIREAGAYIAVVASEHSPDDYMHCLSWKKELAKAWTANVVMTLDRKGDKLARFMVNLFGRMFQGQSMLIAWVELAPQILNYDDPNAPGTILAAEAGHLVFDRGAK